MVKGCRRRFPTASPPQPPSVKRLPHPVTPDSHRASRSSAWLPLASSSRRSSISAEVEATLPPAADLELCGAGGQGHRVGEGNPCLSVPSRDARAPATARTLLHRTCASLRLAAWGCGALPPPPPTRRSLLPAGRAATAVISNQPRRTLCHFTRVQHLLTIAAFAGRAERVPRGRPRRLLAVERLIDLSAGLQSTCEGTLGKSRDL